MLAVPQARDVRPAFGRNAHSIVGNPSQKPLPMSPIPSNATDYWQTLRVAKFPQSPSRTPPTTSRPQTPTNRRSGSTAESIKGPPSLPIHADFHSFLALDATHRSKVYLSSRMFMKADGPTNRTQGWGDIWAQLMGTAFSIWWIEEIEAAQREGKVVLPTTIDVTDAVIGLSKFSPQTAFEVTLPDSTTMHLSCPDENGLVSWVTAFRLACWERSRLEEVFTASLLRTTFGEGSIWIEPPSTIVNGQKEGSMRVCLPGSKDFIHGWGVLTTAVSDDASTSTHDSPNRAGGRRRRSSFFLRRKSSDVTSSFAPACLTIYPSSKSKDRKKPILTLRAVRQAFLVYPEDPDLIFRSTLIKLEGVLNIEGKSPGTPAGREAWMAIVPDAQTGTGRASLRDVVDWVVALHDVFGLHGRPRGYSWDTRDPRSMMFANTPAHDSFFLPKVLAQIVEVSEERTGVIRSRLRDLLAERIAAVTLQFPSAPPLRQPPSRRPANASNSDSAGPVDTPVPTETPKANEPPALPLRPQKILPKPVTAIEGTPSKDETPGRTANQAAPDNATISPGTPTTPRRNDLRTHLEGPQRSLEQVLRSNRAFIGDKMMPEFAEPITPNSQRTYTSDQPSARLVSPPASPTIHIQVAALSEVNFTDESLPLAPRPLSRIIEASVDNHGTSSRGASASQIGVHLQRVASGSTASYASALARSFDHRSAFNTSEAYLAMTDPASGHQQEDVPLTSSTFGGRGQDPAWPSSLAPPRPETPPSGNSPTSDQSTPPPVPEKVDSKIMSPVTPSAPIISPLYGSPGLESVISPVTVGPPVLATARSSEDVDDDVYTPSPTPISTQPHSASSLDEGLGLHEALLTSMRNVALDFSQRSLPLPPLPIHAGSATSLPPPTPPPKGGVQIIVARRLPSTLAASVPWPSPRTQSDLPITPPTAKQHDFAPVAVDPNLTPGLTPSPPGTEQDIVSPGTPPKGKEDRGRPSIRTNGSSENEKRAPTPSLPPRREPSIKTELPPIPKPPPLPDRRPNSSALPPTTPSKEGNPVGQRRPSVPGPASAPPENVSRISQGGGRDLSKPLPPITSESYRAPEAPHTAPIQTPLPQSKTLKRQTQSFDITRWPSDSGGPEFNPYAEFVETPKASEPQARSPPIAYHLPFSIQSRSQSQSPPRHPAAPSRASTMGTPLHRPQSQPSPQARPAPTATPPTHAHSRRPRLSDASLAHIESLKDRFKFGQRQTPRRESVGGNTNTSASTPIHRLTFVPPRQHQEGYFPNTYTPPLPPKTPARPAHVPTPSLELPSFQPLGDLMAEAGTPWFTPAEDMYGLYDSPTRGTQDGRGVRNL